MARVLYARGQDSLSVSFFLVGHGPLLTHFGQNSPLDGASELPAADRSELIHRPAYDFLLNCSGLAQANYFFYYVCSAVPHPI